MSSQSSNLFTLARSKLHLSIGNKDNCSLHRWVLLKNSIIKSNPLTASSVPTDDSVPDHVNMPDEGGEDEEEESDSFMFPDGGQLLHSDVGNVTTSEAGWLDSLLETLGDDDGEYEDSEVHVSTLPVDEDDDQLLSPLMSPMSSSDDLVSPSSFYPPPVTAPYYPYPVPYPPFHPPLIRSHDLHSNIHSALDTNPPPYDDPLPYYDEDVENLSVPDAIEDDSDDESDAPTTPSLIHSHSSSTLDPASIPLPEGRERRIRPHLHVYIGPDDPHFLNPFELDPQNSYDPVYQEC